jgi:hypothetical protein
MTAAEFLRDYLSKWGPEMDPDEYDGIRRAMEALRSIEAVNGISVAVAAEREACAKIAEQRFPEIAAAIRARGSQ